MLKRTITSVRERLWTSRDVCNFLGVGKNAPADLVRSGELPALRIGRRLRFEAAAVRAFAERCRERATSMASFVPRVP